MKKIYAQGGKIKYGMYNERYMAELYYFGEGRL
jgi:hypothetical protein